MKTLTLPKAARAAPVPVLVDAPCPTCMPLDPMGLGRSKDCPTCGGRLLVTNVVRYARPA